MMKNFHICINVITGITLTVIYIPFFILLNEQDSSYERIYDGVSLNESSISHVIKNSSLLALAQICIIVGIIPMVLDIIMDSLVLSKLPDLWGYRYMIVVILAVPSLTFLIFWKFSFMPMLYVVQFLSQNMLYPAVMIRSVSPVVVPSLCLLALAVFGVRCVFEAYITLLHFDGTPYRMAGSNIFMVLSWIIALASSVLGLHKMWRAGLFALKSFRFQNLVPVLAFLISAVACAVTNSVFHATTWPDVSEESLVSYAFIQLVYTVFMTVLPGRVISEDLTLKGIFVRFISHEIRSPLNVVVSGLEFLKDEVAAVSSPAREKLEGLLHEMTMASTSAVDTLTDVLDYELIDAGTLQLDLSWSPLVRFLENKFKWAEIVASTKRVTLLIEDNTVATAAGIRSLRGRPSRDSSFLLELVARDIEEGAATGLSGLSMQPVRQLPSCARSFLHVDASKIGQLLRNVVNNAIDHSPVGGTVTVKLDYSPAGLISTPTTEGVVGMLRIEVCDSGKGFAAEEQEQVAAELLRFHGRDLKGAGCSVVGLGLCIARGIAKLHQGSFDLHSAGIEHGRRIVAELPLYSHPRKRGGRGQGGGGPARHGRSGRFLSDSEKSYLGGSLRTCPRCSRLSRSTSAGGPGGPALPGPHSHTSAPSSALRHGQGVYPDTAAMINPSNVGDVQVEPSPERAVDVACPTDAGASRKSLDGLRFLIVDDSALNRKIIRRILESEQGRLPNAVIEEADDGSSAVSAVQRATEAGLTFDCIFMDFVMIHMNGPEAVKILRNDLKFRRPIIGVTGNALFLAHGTDKVLLKPLNKAQFVATLLSFIMVDR